MSNRSLPSATWPRSLPAEAKAKPVIPCRAARPTSWGACDRTCCSVAGGRGGGADQLGSMRPYLLLSGGRQVRWLGEWLAHAVSLSAAAHRPPATTSFLQR